MRVLFFYSSTVKCLWSSCCVLLLYWLGPWLAMSIKIEVDLTWRDTWARKSYQWFHLEMTKCRYTAANMSKCTKDRSSGAVANSSIVRNQFLDFGRSETAVLIFTLYLCARPCNSFDHVDDRCLCVSDPWRHVVNRFLFPVMKARVLRRLVHSTSWTSKWIKGQITESPGNHVSSYYVGYMWSFCLPMWHTSLWAGYPCKFLCETPERALLAASSPQCEIALFFGFAPLKAA